MNDQGLSTGQFDAPGSTGFGPKQGNESKGGVGPQLRRLATAGMGLLKEGTTTIIAISVAAVSLWMLSEAFSETTLSAEKKEVMTHGLSLLGVVMGYYFGRSPAERRAESAEDAAAKERSQSEKSATVASAAVESQRIAEGKLVDAKVTLAHATEMLEPQSAGPPAALGAKASGVASQPANPADSAFRMLDQLQRRL